LGEGLFTCQAAECCGEFSLEDANVADLATFSNRHDRSQKDVCTAAQSLNPVLLFARKRNGVIEKIVSTNATA
jgi:hypothetical protein